MNQPTKPIRPEQPALSHIVTEEIVRSDLFPHIFTDGLPPGSSIDEEENEYGDVEFVIRSPPKEVPNPNYEKEIKEFDIKWVKYLDDMEVFKTDMKAWKANRANSKRQIEANEHRIKQLQDENKRLKDM